MAKVSVEQRELKREKMVARYAGKHATLKEAITKAKNTEDGAWQACEALQKLPRNALKVRYRRRCNTCGRPRGVYRKFGLCRLCLRKYAMQGLVPGLEKASW